MAKPTNRPGAKRQPSTSAAGNDVDTSTAVAELFDSPKRPKKNALSTYITVATSARLERLVREHDLTTTDVVEKALTRLLDDMNVPQADSHGHFTED
ncbi:hypothetical protein [Rhodococcus pyridinivorans]|uniref:hypothetical protein n=1 Tax=Rhodococcus pyridinivorans TaxID=103816 RepID=UPI002658503C|nr:hypothetical protein [Rhodococcus pyridinivorans]